MRVRTELDPRGVLTVTLDDPERRNALSNALVAELTSALRRAAEPDVRVVVLTHTGTVFCAGADLSERRPGVPSADPATVFAAIQELSKPVVARIAGPAIAGGLGLAAAADISIAVSSAAMGFTEVRIGVAPAIIATVCLPKMSRAAAAEVMLRGQRFDATRAAELGLVNEAVAAEALDARVEEVVADLLEGAPSALGAVKQLLRRLPEMPFDDALEWTARLSMELFGAAEGQEGMQAFLEKRPPAWSPRAAR